VMIYASLLERRVLIEPGDGLRGKLPPGAFVPVRDRLVEAIRAGKSPGAALAASVEQAAQIVGPAAPPTAAPLNRLPNTLHLLS
jgi:uncharacterized membrane protein